MSDLALVSETVETFEAIKERRRLSAKKRRAQKWANDPEHRKRAKAAYAKWYQANKNNPERKKRIREYHRKRRLDPDKIPLLRANTIRYLDKYRISSLAKHVISRCKRSGMKCDIEFIRSMRSLRPETCPCCGVPLDYAYSGASKRAKINGPSFDRVDTSKGYVRGNVEIICWRCNALKRDALLHELEAIVVYMRARL
jgi:hypothetical protein